MTVLDVYTDFICPWCYLGSARTDRLVREYDVELRMNYFPLHPGLPPEGKSMEELFRGRNFDLKAANDRLGALLKAEGLDWTPPVRTYDTRLAQELAKWAQVEKGVDLTKDFYRAFFVRAENLGDPEVLLSVIRERDLPEDEARKVLTERTWKQAIDEDWRRSRSIGITGVPTYVLGRRGVVGAQPYEVLERVVTEAGAQKRPPS